MCDVTKVWLNFGGELVVHNIKIIVLFNKIKNKIKPTPNERNLTHDMPDNF